MKRWVAWVVVAVVAVGLLVGSRGTLATHPDPAARALLSSTQTPEWVARRVEGWLPTARERLWENIAWTEGLQNALEKARAVDRPVLLFSYAGCVEGRL